MKACAICGEVKALEAFWADSRRPDGRQTRCAACANQRRAQTKRYGPPPPKPMYLAEDRGYESPCWIWQRGKTGKGYGAHSEAGRVHSAHRWVYERLPAEIPPGYDLDHLCRVRDCVNPAHLEPVLNAENIRRGRLARLTWDDVEAIRASSASIASLADAYRVSQSHIEYIRAGKRWNPDKKWLRTSTAA